ncbi:SPFH domain-containing protein [Fundidesulfovibrio butyratiphilus]
MISPGLVAVAAVTFFVCALVVKGVIIVKQSETMVVERLGRFHRVLDSGVHVIWPVIDQVRQIEWKSPYEDAQGRKVVLRKLISRIDLREVVYDFPKQKVITKDNVITEINALLYYQIVDPKRVVYEIANLTDAIEKLTQTSLRNVIGEMELDEVLTARDKINKTLQVILDEATEKWGVKVNRTELQDITPPDDVKAALEKQMRAERDRRAQILEAEGGKQAQILESEGARAAFVNKAEGQKTADIRVAEGQAQARVLAAKAEAEAVRRVAEAFGPDTTSAVQYLVAVKYLDTLREMASGDKAKIVYLPYEATGVLGAVGAVKDLVGKVSKA